MREKTNLFQPVPLFYSLVFSFTSFYLSLCPYSFKSSVHACRLVSDSKDFGQCMRTIWSIRNHPSHGSLSSSLPFLSLSPSLLFLISSLTLRPSKLANHGRKLPVRLSSPPPKLLLSTKTRWRRREMTHLTSSTLSPNLELSRLTRFIFFRFLPSFPHSLSRPSFMWSFPRRNASIRQWWKLSYRTTSTPSKCSSMSHSCRFSLLSFLSTLFLISKEILAACRFYNPLSSPFVSPCK